MAVPLRLRFVRATSFAPFAKTRIPDELLQSWVGPSARDAEVRRDARKFTLGLDKRYTLEAAEHLPSFEKPALLAWAPGDRFFPLSYAERLADALPDSRLELIEDAKTFVPLDQPDRLADAITAFMREESPAPA
jgi:pimeloyl-ACP methyl ester carboxylesterase